LKGLRGDYELGDAYSDQYDPMKPSWAVGLVFDMPFSNRIGKARHLRRLVEIRQLVNQLQTTIETVLLEVQVSVREINTSYREMLAKYNAMEANRKKLDALNARRSLMFGSGESQNIYLERLLDHQQDVSSAEQDFLTSYVAYNIAHANLNRAKGVLLQVKELQFCEDVDESKIPRLYLQNKKSSQECAEHSVPSPIPAVENNESK
jgi:outer membrane protein TolC